MAAVLFTMPYGNNLPACFSCNPRVLLVQHHDKDHFSTRENTGDLKKKDQPEAEEDTEPGPPYNMG